MSAPLAAQVPASRAPFATSSAAVGRAPSRSLLARITSTTNDPVLTLVRVVLGVVMLAHGSQKVLGWFGGPGFSGTMGFMTGMMHIPTVFAILAITAEFAGGLGLIVGLFGRIAAFGVASVMVVAIATVHLANGFFMNWSGAQKGEGFEYHLLALVLAAVVMVRGSGRWALDGLFRRG